MYEEIELTKDGQAKLNELLNDYALLATDVTEIENAKTLHAIIETNKNKLKSIKFTFIENILKMVH